MAVTVQLTDGTNTVDLNDGTTFTTRNISMPTPTYRTAMSGAGNLDRSGSYLLSQSYNNRSIALNVMVDGTSMDNLIANVNTVHDILRRATDFSQHGFGSQVYLNYQQDSATNAIRFNVIQGTYNPLGNVNFPALNIADVLTNTVVSLVCEPFGIMAQESFTNYVASPSFEEASAISANWVQAHVATGTSANDATEYIFGAQNGKLVMTDSTSGGEWIGRYQDIASAAGVTWSLYFWGRLSAASNSVLKLVAQFLDSSDNVLLEEDWILDSTHSTDYSRLVLTSIKSPTNTDTLRVWFRLESSAVDATGTAFIDGWFANQATSFPIAWMSGRAMFNHLEGGTMAGADSQAELNYLDLYDVPGDIPSLMQIKVTENEAHTKLWIGARHADRLADEPIYHEGNQFTGGYGLASTSEATASNGVVGRWDASSAGSASTNAASPTIGSEVVASPPVGQYRVLVRAKQGGTDLYNLALGYTTGGVTVDPSVAADYADMQVTNNSLIDLGTLTISKPPDNMTVPSITLRFAFYLTTTTTSEDLDLDYVFLLPVDFGGIHITKASGTDVLLVDGISRRRMVWIIDASNVIQSLPPAQSGIPPQVHPLGTRLYFASDNGHADKDDGCTVNVTLEHRFLSMRGA